MLSADTDRCSTVASTTSSALSRQYVYPTNGSFSASTSGVLVGESHAGMDVHISSKLAAAE